MSTSGSLGIGLSHFPNSVHVNVFWDCILDIVMFCCRDWVLLDCCKECWWFCVSRQSTWLDSNSDRHTCSGQWLSSLVSAWSEAASSLSNACVIRGWGRNLSETQTWNLGFFLLWLSPFWEISSLAVSLVLLVRKMVGSLLVSAALLSPPTCCGHHWVTVAILRTNQGEEIRQGSGGLPACSCLLQLPNTHQDLPACFQSAELSASHFCVSCPEWMNSCYL